jgi:hypothetical protein
MPAIQEDKQRRDPEAHRRETLNAVIRQQVLQGLGQPGDLLWTRVQLLWDNHYRVNVVVGPNITSPRIAHSYFLVVDGDGRIVASTPTITRQF